MIRDPVVRKHVRQRVIQRLHVGVQLFLEVTRQESEILSGFHGRTRHDDAPHLLLLERLYGQSHGGVSLAGTGGTNGKHHVVVPHGIHQLPLVRRSCRHPKSARPIDERVVFGGGPLHLHPVLADQPLEVILLDLAVALEVPDDQVPLGGKLVEVILGPQGLDLISPTHQLEFGEMRFQRGKLPVSHTEELEGRHIRKVKASFRTHVC